MGNCLNRCFEWHTADVLKLIEQLHTDSLLDKLELQKCIHDVGNLTELVEHLQLERSTTRRACTTSDSPSEQHEEIAEIRHQIADLKALMRVKIDQLQSDIDHISEMMNTSEEDLLLKKRKSTPHSRKK
eukprot:9014-Heterococcus_DN1.PRE.3